MTSYSFNFFLTAANADEYFLGMFDKASWLIAETRIYFGSRSEAFDLAWSFCEQNYDCFDDAE